MREEIQEEMGPVASHQKSAPVEERRGLIQVWYLERVKHSNRFASILEQNRQQAEMINFLLERNKQLQEKLGETVVSI